jgi:hypothetical protein
MTKSVRKASAWSSREVQSDPSGYARAQEAERADARAERERMAEADTLRYFSESYVQNGGDPNQAEDAFRRPQRSDSHTSQGS